MIFRYTFARLKSSVGLTALGTVSLFVIFLVLILVTAMPLVFGDILTVFYKHVYDDANIIVVPNEGQRFFDSSTVKTDPIIAENTDYVIGYFMAIANISRGGTAEESLFFAGNYAEHRARGTFTADVPEILYDDEVIINKALGSALSAGIGDTLPIELLGKTLNFKIIGITEDRGFFTVGNSIFVSSRALSRFSPLLASGIVTCCIMKTKSEGVRETVQTHIKNTYPALLSHNLSPKANVRTATVAPAFVALFVLLFCMLGLVVLLRLIFARERGNFDTFRALGMPERRIKTICVLRTVVMALPAFLCAAACGFLINKGIIGISPLFDGIKFSLWPYFAGLLCGMCFSVLCTLLCVKSVRKTSPGFRKTFLFKHYKTIFGLRLRTLAVRKDFRRFRAFIFSGLVAVLLLVIAITTIKTAAIGVFQSQAGLELGGSKMKARLGIGNFIDFFFSDFYWIMDFFTGALIVLAAVTALLMIIIRRIAMFPETEKLLTMGLRARAEIFHNMFSISVLLAPILVAVPAAVFLVCRVSSPIFLALDVNVVFIFDFWRVFSLTLLSYVLLFAAEILTCTLMFWRKTKKAAI